MPLCSNWQEPVFWLPVLPEPHRKLSHCHRPDRSPPSGRTGGSRLGFLPQDGAEPMGVMMMSESLSIYAGGSFGVTTELFIIGQHPIEAGDTLGRERGWRQPRLDSPRQPMGTRPAILPTERLHRDRPPA